ncbi:MAG TPA: SRPBCC domain-containing protein [Ferruginibacter sp.]|nr:SRPBCC domain-containing protein [Ferruginibacter sp.]
MQTENISLPGLKKINFSISINASKEKVWNALWDNENYKKWTAAFSEGSHAVTDWNEGSKILFLDGKGSGMYSTIAKKVPLEIMSFRHIGEVKDGVEQPLDERTKAWSGGLETYTLKEKDGITTVHVELDMLEDFKDYFTKTFPVALENVKKLAEGKPAITIEATVHAPVEKVWSYWTNPEHITQWNNASPDWHTPHATNDLQAGGKFLSRMEAKDGSMGFDFWGIYDEVKTNELIANTLGDGRKMSVHFTAKGDTTKIAESFEAEEMNSLEMQRGGWQSILDNFKKYTEAN